jgi:hypothetical protein
MSAQLPRGEYFVILFPVPRSMLLLYLPATPSIEDHALGKPGAWRETEIL